MAWQTIGQEPARALLEQSVASGRIAHAYLLVGPASSGKTTLALDLACALVCTGSPRPCGACTPCRLVMAGAHPDVVQVEREDADVTDFTALWVPSPSERPSRALRIERVRELIRECALRPTMANYRVATLDGSMVLGPAASALLKLFEEPSDSMVLLLRATAEEAVPAPIVSRCQVARLRPVPQALIASWLESTLKLSPDDATGFAAVSNGRPGLARRLAQLPESLASLHERAATLLALLEADTVACLEQAGAWGKNPVISRAALDLAALVWHDLLRMAAGGQDSPVALNGLRQELGAAAARHGLPALARQLRAIERASRLLDANVQPRLILEWLFLEFQRPTALSVA